MLDSVSHIAAALKAARKEKKISQRMLSLKTKVPQSHLSKIENGMIDLQTSSLIEISRVLGLELMLVPHNLVPSFQALLDSKLNDGHQIPMYRLDREEEEKV